MDVIYFDYVSVSSEWLTNNLQLFILFTNFVNQIGSFRFHAVQKFMEKHSLIVNPSGLVSNLSNLFIFIIANDKSVFYSSLVFKFVKWIFLIIAHLIHNEYFLSEDFLLVLEVINNHNRNFIFRSSYIEWKNFLPVWVHVQRSHDLICMFYLFIIIHYYLNHWFELIWRKEFRVELTINDVKIKSRTFHDFNTFYFITRWSFFQHL